MPLQDIILPASDESDGESESQSGASERGSFEQQNHPVLQTSSSAAMHQPDLTRTMSTRSAGRHRVRQTCSNRGLHDTACCPIVGAGDLAIAPSLCR